MPLQLKTAITLLITAVLLVLRVRGAILIGLAGGTVLAIVVEAIWNPGPRVGDGARTNQQGWGLTVPELPGSLVSVPDLGLVGQVSLGSFEQIGVLAPGSSSTSHAARSRP